MINNKYNMKDGETFIITYTKKNGEEITRNGKFIIGKCGEWISKTGNKLFTVFLSIILFYLTSLVFLFLFYLYKFAIKNRRWKVQRLKLLKVYL